MIEQKIEVKLTITDFQPILAAHEGKAASEFDQKFLDMSEQPGFEFALVEGFFQGEEIEEIGVLQQTLGETGMRLREGVGEVGDGTALALMGAVLDLNRESVAAPALFKGLTSIPEAGKGASPSAGRCCVSPGRPGVDPVSSPGPQRQGDCRGLGAAASPVPLRGP